MEPKPPKPDEPVRDADYWQREAEHNRLEKLRVQAMIDMIITSGATCREEDTQPYTYRSADDGRD